jgi:hypothetical protein
MINEYVKGKKFSDLSTDGYDWQKWCNGNNAELERRLAAHRLENCSLNGRILVEFAQETNIPVTMDALFNVVNDPRYSGRLVYLPAPKPVPVPAPTVAGLGYTRRSLTQMSAVEMKALLHNEKIGPIEEVQRQINIVLAQPAESAAYQPKGDELLRQMGVVPIESRVDKGSNQPSDQERKAHNLRLRQAEWDKANREIGFLTVQGPGGRTNHAKSEEAQRLAKERLGTRPEAQ